MSTPSVNSYSVQPIDGGQLLMYTARGLVASDTGKVKPEHTVLGRLWHSGVCAHPTELVANVSNPISLWQRHTLSVWRHAHACMSCSHSGVYNILVNDGFLG